MAVQPVPYVRKPFYVDAVEVTAENMEEAAAWCGGRIWQSDNGDKYIKVHVHRPLNERQTKAFVGDHILKHDKAFKVYTPKAFENSFEAVTPSKDTEELRTVSS